jgi:hypothetical protein
VNMLIELTSRKNLPDKAAIALLDRARGQGFQSIGAIAYEFLPDAEDGKVHKFSAEAA